MRSLLSQRRAWPVVVVLVMIVLGVVAGVVWRALWTAPTGAALDGRFLLDGPGARSSYDATALFVLVSAAVGLVAGLVIGWLTRRDELLVLAASVLGAAGATAVMYLVGHALGPPDPAAAAAGAADLTPLRDELTLAGRASWLVLPAAVLMGLVVTLLGSGSRRADPDDGSAGSSSLDWRGEPREATAASAVGSLGSPPVGADVAPPGPDRPQ